MTAWVATVLALTALCTPWTIRAVEGGDADAVRAAFKRAGGTRAWSFPRDHGAHPAYKLEWWYYTGIVRTEGGRRFGYQVTFFRQGIVPDPPRRASAWATRNLYSAHLALSDLRAGRYHTAARAGRDGPALAGASQQRHKVWLTPWRADPLPDDPHGVRLSAVAEPFALELTLRAQKGPVLHGEGGLDRKGADPGQASWYYSMPRLATAGTLTVDGETHRVSGTTWMDHEFGTSQLGPEQVGWDWFSLRLSDGYDLMLYRLRHADGSADPRSGGSLIAPDGTRTPVRLTRDGVRLEPLEHWRSPRTQTRYPVAWRVELPRHNLSLRVEAAMPRQELTATPGIPFSYWEGVIDAEGRHAGRAVTVEGYLELTGYDGRLGGALRE